MTVKNTYMLIVISLISLMSITNAMCQFTEYELKAAYTFKFAKFIEWPANNISNDTITIGIYKEDPFGVVLEKTMIGRKANGKDWKIIRTQKRTDLEKCDIVFFSDIEKYELSKILDQLKNKPILTIGDEIIDFCEMGGTINFTPQFSEYQFEINNDVAKSKNIRISHKLLLLAKVISNNEDEF